MHRAAVAGPVGGTLTFMPTNGSEESVRFDTDGRALIAVVQLTVLTDRDAGRMRELVLERARSASDRVCVVALDISAMDTVNSVLLGMLVNLMTKLRLRGLGFCLVGVDPAIREMLSVTRLDRVFNVARTRADIEAFCE